jgi:hypothetical protein
MLYEAGVDQERARQKFSWLKMETWTMVTGRRARIWIRLSLTQRNNQQKFRLLPGTEFAQELPE